MRKREWLCPILFVLLVLLLPGAAGWSRQGNPAPGEELPAAVAGPTTASIPVLSRYYTDTGLNPYCYHTWDQYSYAGQCTWYVYGKIQEMNLVEQSRLSPDGGPNIFRSHARSWVTDVASAPVLLSIEESPRPGDIAFWPGGYGHVAFVEEVTGGRVLVTESNIHPHQAKHVVVGSPTGIRLRSSREVRDDNLVTVAPRFSVLEVLDGPRSGGGYTWYRLRDSDGVTGWAARLGAGAVYNYTGIILEPSPPVLGNPHSYIRIHGGTPAPPEPSPAMEGLSIRGWDVAEQRVAAGDTLRLRLDLANDGNEKKTFIAGAILDGPGGKRIVLDKEVTLPPKRCMSITLQHRLDIPGEWDLQFGIWERKPLADASLLMLFPPSPMEGYITVELERPAASSITFPGSSLAPGTVLDTLTPLLEWNTVSGADYYEVWISREPYGEQNIVHSSGPVEATGYRVPEGVLRDGESYRWNMAASNSAGRSNFSNRLYFRVDLGHDPAEPVPAGQDPWRHWRAMVEQTIHVNYYSPKAGKVVRPWVYRDLWTLPRSGADYNDVLALRDEQPVYVYWTEADWRALCEAVGPRELLARLIHSEAACQGETGWITIANNVLNRVASPAYPNTICAVIFEIRVPSTPQYCGVLTERFLKFDNENVRRGIYEVVDRALEGILEDITGGATAYYNPNLADSKWHESSGEVVRIGDHVFVAGEQPAGRPPGEVPQVEFDSGAPFLGQTDAYWHVGNARISFGMNMGEVTSLIGEPEDIVYHTDDPFMGDYLECSYPFMKITFYPPLGKEGQFTEYLISNMSTSSPGVYGPRNIHIGESFDSVLQKFSDEGNELEPYAWGGEGVSYRKMLYGTEHAVGGETDSRGIVFYDRNKEPVRIVYSHYPWIGIEITLVNKRVAGFAFWLQLS